jgi:EpsI family protein
LAARIGVSLEQVARLNAPLAELPKRLGDWEGQDVPIDERVLNVGSFDDDYVNRVYVNPDLRASVNVFVGYVGRPRAWLGHRPDVCYASQGWDEVAQQKVSVATVTGQQVPSVLYEFQHPHVLDARMLVLATYLINGRYSQDVAEFRNYNARSPNWSADRPPYLARIQVSLRANGDREADLAALRAFAAVVVEPTARMMPY